MENDSGYVNRLQQMKDIFRLSVIALFLLVFSIISLITYRNKTAQKNIRRIQYSTNLNSPSPTNPTISPTTIPDDAIFNEVPALYSGLSWQLVSKENQKLNNPGIFAEKNKEAVSVSLPGNEWVAESSGEHDFNIEDYYQNALKGWSTNIPSFSISDVKFNVISAGGPFGSTLGLFIIRDNKLRIVNTNNYLPNYGVNKDKEYHVFVSDIMTQQELLNLVK